MKRTPLKPYFETTPTREELVEFLKIWKPVGSGPLTVMTQICRLALTLNRELGYEPITEEEIGYPIQNS